MNLDQHLADLDAKEDFEAYLEEKALTISSELKSSLGFVVGSLTYTFDDVLADDEYLAEQLRCCLSLGSFYHMEKYLDEAVYKYAMILAEELYV